MTPRRFPPPPIPPLNKLLPHGTPTEHPQLQQPGGQSPTRRPNKGKEKMGGTLKFPGFVNTFLSNTPLHPPKNRLASSHREIEPPVEGTVAPPSENFSSPLSSPIKSATRPLSSRQPFRPQPAELLEPTAHQEATIDIEMGPPDMETGTDVDALIEEPSDPEDFLSFEPLSPQDEVPTTSKSDAYMLKISLSFAMLFYPMQRSQGPSQHCSFSSPANRRISPLCETTWMLALQSLIHWYLDHLIFYTYCKPCVLAL